MALIINVIKHFVSLSSVSSVTLKDYQTCDDDNNNYPLRGNANVPQQIMRI